MLDRFRVEICGEAEGADRRAAAVACVGTIAMAIRRLEELDLAAAVVARALLSELGGAGKPESGRPLEQTVIVTPNELLAYAAVRQVCRNVSDVADFLRCQVTALRDVTFWVNAGAGDAETSPARFDEAPLFNIVEVREWSDDDAAADAPAVAVHWMVRGGLWAGSHLRRACRGPLCRVARASLEPMRESAASLALRVGSMLMADACLECRNGAQTMTVEALLAAVGRLPHRQLRTASWGRRMADDLRDAVRALTNAGFHIGIDAPYLPVEKALDPAAIDGWLQSDSTFMPQREMR